MSEAEKNDLEEMIEIAKFLSEEDPKSIPILKSNMQILKARKDMEDLMRAEENGDTAIAPE
ncbi:hypothetical protein [Hominifimenecus sp. rT4P-3]|uniref:hypothetical protein n=1 Tax=Hominifimenecus sp. rT4P-3 TaxID=3242979 RepID=UPI003DA491AC